MMGVQNKSGMRGSCRHSGEQSIRTIAVRILVCITLPLTLGILIFTYSMLLSVREQWRDGQCRTLEADQYSVSDTVRNARDYLETTASTDINFQMFRYTSTKTGMYASARQLEPTARSLMAADPLVGGVAFYQSDFDYLHCLYQGSFKKCDLESIHTYIRNSVRESQDNITGYDSGNAAGNAEGISGGLWASDDPRVGKKCSISTDYSRAGSVRSEEPDKESGSAGPVDRRWNLLHLSDRQLCVFTMKVGNCALTAWIDPAKLEAPAGTSQSVVYLADQAGEPLSGGYQNMEHREEYKADIAGTPVQVVLLTPHRSLFEQMEMPQRVLLIFIFVLLLSIPVSFYLLYRFLLQPVEMLRRETEEAAGDGKVRFTEQTGIYEISAISELLNNLVEKLKQQKIVSYEREIALRDINLHYLHLQLRPHFFLNCLNVIYSMAEEKRCDAIQDMIIDLSVYLRSIFRDGIRTVALADEVRSVESYIRITGAGYELPPKLHAEIGARTQDLKIPPMCILTFVENAVKHYSREKQQMEIFIQTSLLEEEGRWIDIKIRDNGGGFSEEQLSALNAGQNPAGKDGHIGILNIREQLHYLYQGRAAMIFQNVLQGAMVELFLPVLEEKDVTAGKEEREDVTPDDAFCGKGDRACETVNGR
jgi:two-component system sensor histidine kinase YesM